MAVMRHKLYVETTLEHLTSQTFSFWFRTFLRAVVGLARCGVVDGFFWNLLGPSLLECPLNFLCALDEPNLYKTDINLLFLCAILNFFYLKKISHLTLL